ncbi:phage tail length tape measure family protein, partial [Streptomyces sp. G35A]
SANEAGKAVDGIGGGAEKSAEKFTRAEARIRDSIKKSTQELQLLGKTASEKLEFKIADRGLDASKFAPYIAELKKAEDAQRVASGSLDKMGMSAKQTVAALRQVPAQFTDIIVSLQGGQAPLTVFLQQGGQLKDVFGGAGAAARALGGYVMGLVNPLTILAATAAGIAVAYNQGSKERDAFVRSIVTTGNASGVTTSQLRDYARAID